jgi:ADP-ribose pyrophosphatase
MLKRWPIVSTELAENYRIFDVRRERYVSPRTSASFERVVIECPGWVNVIALTPADDVVMVRQFRFGSGEVTLEIPGGIVDPGETPLAAAARELREETGYAPERITALGSIAPNPAFQRNLLHSFLAEGCRKVGELQPDAGEDLEVVLHPRGEIRALLANGMINHALVAIAFQKLELHEAGFALA